MSADFNDAARTLILGVLADHPDWERNVLPYGPADDREAEAGSVRFWVPAPLEPKHHLEIALRGNTIEVAYDCGSRGLRAEKQFIFREGEMAEVAAEVRTFLNDLCRGDVVVVRESLGRVTRAVRRDGVSELAWFRTAQESEAAKPGRYVVIHAWTMRRSAGGGAA